MKVKDTVLVLKAISNVKPSRYYTASFKRKVLKLAVLTTANHASVMFGVRSSIVRDWLRSVGLESAINPYYWK